MIIGNDINLGALSSAIDDDIATGVITQSGTIILMSIEDLSIAAVIINSQVTASILENHTCGCRAGATGQAANGAGIIE